MKSVDPDLPKEMLDIAGKPAIQYAVEEGLAAGIARAVIVISPAKDIIRAYFENPAVSRSMYPISANGVKEIRRRIQIEFVVQSEPEGEAHAICLARASAGHGPVAVIYPDNLCIPPQSALVELWET
jgi:UTP--glucose-1-phosphate uridylyltransferase